MQAERVEQNLSVVKLEWYLSFHRATAEEAEGFANLISSSYGKSRDQPSSNQSTECLNNKFRCWLTGKSLLIYIGQSSSKGRFIVASVYTINKGVIWCSERCTTGCFIWSFKKWFSHELGGWFSEVLDFMNMPRLWGELPPWERRICCVGFLPVPGDREQNDKRIKPPLRWQRKKKSCLSKGGGEICLLPFQRSPISIWVLEILFVHVVNTGSSAPGAW